VVPDLSPLPVLNDLLRSLLAEAVSWLQNRTHEHPYRALVLLGSGAASEACGVRLPEAGGRDDGSGTAQSPAKWMPLSDLDLGLICHRPEDYPHLTLLRDQFNREFDQLVSKLGLTHNPLDLGIINLSHLKRSSMTLEVCEAVRQPVFLDGDQAAFSELSACDPAPFEALRLLANRVAETVAPTGLEREKQIESTAGALSPSDWFRAYRHCKLILDMGKVLLAAEGSLEPSYRKRLKQLSLRCRSANSLQMEEVEKMIAAWTRWREAPSWPPPELPPAACSVLADQCLGAICGALGISERQLNRSDATSVWRTILSLEGGPAMERLRHWRSLLLNRPESVSFLPAAAKSMRWFFSAWPATLGALSLMLFWSRAMSENSSQMKLTWLGAAGRSADRFADRLPLARISAEGREQLATDEMMGGGISSPGYSRSLDFLEWNRKAGR